MQRQTIVITKGKGSSFQARDTWGHEIARCTGFLSLAFVVYVQFSYASVFSGARSRLVPCHAPLLFPSCGLRICRGISSAFVVERCKDLVLGTGGLVGVARVVLVLVGCKHFTLEIAAEGLDMREVHAYCS
jgi:hypothetical protein